MYIKKKHGKITKAYKLGETNPVLDRLTAEGKIKHNPDGTYAVLSREAALGGGSGQIAQAGDYVKVDSNGFPYPNSREFFELNHIHVSGDDYEQIPQRLLAWTVNEPMTGEVEYLIRAKGLVLAQDNPARYFNAPLWGEHLSAPKDAAIVFYSITYNDAGEITDADFNFVVKEELDLTYDIVG